MQIVITSYFFLEFPVVIMEIVEKLGDILREVEGRGFDLQVERLVSGPWSGGAVEVSSDRDVDCAMAEPPASVTTITAEARLAARL
jgi:hypothetical protein